MTSVASVRWVHRDSGGTSVYAQPALNIAFILYETPYAQVVVSAWAAGDAGAASDGSRCAVLFGVNSKGERTAWPKDCPEVSKRTRSRRLRDGGISQARFGRSIRSVSRHLRIQWMVPHSSRSPTPRRAGARRVPRGPRLPQPFQGRHRPPLKLRGRPHRDERRAVRSGSPSRQRAGRSRWTSRRVIRRWPRPWRNM